MPALVAEDVAEGFISAAAARKLYGVVLRGNMSLDESATTTAAKAARIGAKAKPAKQKQKPRSEPKGRRDDKTSSSFRGARSANPESRTQALQRLWIPGSPLRGAPE